MILDRIKEQLDKRQRGMTGGSRLIGDQNPPSPPDEPPVRASGVETPEAAVEALIETMARAEWAHFLTVYPGILHGAFSDKNREQLSDPRAVADRNAAADPWVVGRAKDVLASAERQMAALLAAGWTPPGGTE